MGQPITVVETREDVVTAAAQFFRLPDDPDRLTIELTDGFSFVATTQADPALRTRVQTAMARHTTPPPSDG